MEKLNVKDISNHILDELRADEVVCP